MRRVTDQTQVKNSAVTIFLAFGQNILVFSCVLVDDIRGVFWKIWHKNSEAAFNVD